MNDSKAGAARTFVCGRASRECGRHGCQVRSKERREEDSVGTAEEESLAAADRTTGSDGPRESERGEKANGA